MGDPRRDAPLVPAHIFLPKLRSSGLTLTDEVSPTATDDEGPLSRRKIWSRWSKWAACSASCGGGAAVRRRRCVAGRCAEGELEEQRRACAMAPCPGATADYD
ncbi:unnamed protein product [Plutella xylostella]|uniref:(diamondback moth) hypothetical protein n=1 Tax=Plutella xylostella TaxID=51655 RepID=A0A8S4GHC5_PLUXY|nr:unnamed protein product [Plutella xylostella]